MNSTQIHPYLFFHGRADAALAFYQKALCAEVGMIMRFKESPDECPEGMMPDNWDEKIMHGEFKVGDATMMISDGSSKEGSFDGFSISLSVENEEVAQKMFAALSEGGEVRMPIGKTFWSPCFGMVADKFGLGWMIGVHPEQQG